MNIVTDYAHYVLYRDPGVRMGAWENPPQDIMGSPFFIGIRWEAIYERRVDGPWIPEVPTFGKQKSRKSTPNVGGEGEGAGQGGTGGEHDPHEEVYADYNTAHKSQKIERPPASEAGEGDEDSDSGSDEEGEDDDDEYMNSKGMRDSVFLKSRGQLENQLADWSFMDEQVLRSVNEAEQKEEEDAEERKKRKEQKNAEKLKKQQERQLARLTECDEGAAEAEDDETVETTTTASPVPSTAGATSEPNSPAEVTVDEVMVEVASETAAAAPVVEGEAN